MPHTDSRCRRRRRRVALLSLLLVAIVAGVVGWAAPSLRRVAMLEAIGVFYAVYAPYTQRPDVPCGPAEISPLPGDVTVAGHRVTISVERVPRPVAPDFRHELTSAASIRKFRESAAELLAGDADPFELSRRLRALTRHAEVPLPDVGTNPQAYLEFALEGTPLTCRYFAVIHGAMCVANGYTSRVLGLSADGVTFAHAVTEVYVPQLSKWVLIDCDFNVAYKIGGEWSSAAELHACWERLLDELGGKRLEPNELKSRVAAIKASIPGRLGLELVELSGAGSNLRASNLYGASYTGLNLEFFANVFYATRNDYLSASYPRAHPHRVRQYLLRAWGVSGLLAVCP